jgi:hypothetical protein
MDRDAMSHGDLTGSAKGDRPLRVTAGILAVSGCGLGERMSTQIVSYQLDDSTTVRFEIEPPPGFRPAGAEEIADPVREAVGPAVEAAKTVVDKVKEARPDQVELRFGIKVSGGANWLVAKAADEANFEISLTWLRKGQRADASGE